MVVVLPVRTDSFESSSVDMRAAIMVGHVQVDLARAALVGKFRLLHAGPVDDALHGVHVAGNDGDLGNIALDMVLRHGGGPGGSRSGAAAVTLEIVPCIRHLPDWTTMGMLVPWERRSE